MSRHHILPPIVYTPAPSKPKETRRRRGVGYSEAAGETEETEEAGEASHTAPARGAAALPQPSTPLDAAEPHIPSTTGKLSDGTLKELLLAQEQESAPGGGAAPAAKPRFSRVWTSVYRLNEHAAISIVPACPRPNQRRPIAVQLLRPSLQSNASIDWNHRIIAAVDDADDVPTEWSTAGEATPPPRRSPAAPSPPSPSP